MSKDEKNWCLIPAGTVVIIGARGSYVSANEEKTFDVAEFSIAKYPITNAEFSRFIDAGGYNNADFWTHEGWDYRTREDWTEPKFWADDTFNQNNHPVVGITWYEALAYCQWLEVSDDSIPTSHISLASEQQWQRAAQGDTKFNYPWGIDFKENFANTKESDFQATTPISQYPQSASPFGVMDMAGNVLEWTLTDWSSGSNNTEQYESNRILRGGSFANSQRIATVQARSYSNSYFRRNNFGFRICANPNKAD